jgi:uncharacterized protein involved in copper resistance
MCRLHIPDLSRSDKAAALLSHVDNYLLALVRYTDLNPVQENIGLFLPVVQTQAFDTREMVGVVADEYVVVHHGDCRNKNVRIGDEVALFLQRGIDIGGFFDCSIGYREDVVERAKRLKSVNLP